MLHELIYSVDLAKNSKSETKMKGDMDQLPQACDNYDLTISTKYHEVVPQPAPGKPYSEPTITVNGLKPQVVDNFTYLSTAVQIGDEVAGRTVTGFSRLRANVWREIESDFTLI